MKKKLTEKNLIKKPITADGLVMFLEAQEKHNITAELEAKLGNLVIVTIDDSEDITFYSSFSWQDKQFTGNIDGTWKDEIFINCNGPMVCETSQKCVLYSGLKKIMPRLEINWSDESAGIVGMSIKLVRPDGGVVETKAFTNGFHTGIVFSIDDLGSNSKENFGKAYQGKQEIKTTDEKMTAAIEAWIKEQDDKLDAPHLNMFDRKYKVTITIDCTVTPKRQEKLFDELKRQWEFGSGLDEDK